jgi:hypothetical protein
VQAKLGPAQPNLGLVQAKLGLAQPNSGLAQAKLGFVQPNLGLVQAKLAQPRPFKLSESNEFFCLDLILIHPVTERFSSSSRVKTLKNNPGDLWGFSCYQILRGN